MLTTIFRARTPASGPRLGTRAPGFRLPSVLGPDIELEDVLKRAKRAAVVFYRSSRCVHCVRQLSQLSREHRTLARHGIEVLAIGGEPAGEGRRLLDRVWLHFPLLMDLTGDVMRRYRLARPMTGVRRLLYRRRPTARPYVVLVDQDGRIRWLRSADARRRLVRAAEVIAAARAPAPISYLADGRPPHRAPPATTSRTLGAAPAALARPRPEADAVASVLPIIAHRFGVDEHQLRPWVRLVDDLGGSSLTMVELALTLEEQLDVEIPADEMERVQTVQQAVECVRRARLRNRSTRAAMPTRDGPKPRP